MYKRQINNIQNLDGDISIKYDDSLIGFYTEKTSIVVRQTAGEYPNYEAVIPYNNDKTLRVNCEDFKSSLQRVDIFTNELTHQIVLDLKSKDKLLITTQTQRGSAQEELPCEYSGESMQIGYNARFLIEILNRIDTDDVMLYLKDPLSAAMIKPTEQKENRELLYLLMPIRLE